jgi:hypothetical protein
MRRRTVQKRKLLKRGLILCEGETEEIYFKGLTNDNKYRDTFASISVDIYKPKNHSPVGLIEEAKDRVKKAKKERNAFDFVWVVFDKDGHQDLPKAFSDANDFNPNINIAFTVICFEYFILLHFEKTTTPYRRCDDLIGDLKKHIPNYKKASNLYEELRDKISTGVKNSEWSYNQSKAQLLSGRKPFELSYFSNVHQLMNYLFSL